MKTGVYGGISDTDYHADRDSLSSSSAKLLLPPSCPAKFKERMDNPPVSSPVFDFGKLVHKLVLGEGAEIAEVPFDDWRSKDARSARLRAHMERKIPVLTADLNKAMVMANMVLAHPLAAGLFTDGRAETSLFAEDPDTGVMLRARPDYMGHRGGRLIVTDYKTAADANPDTFGRTAMKWGYHIQAAWYIKVAQLLKLDNAPTFLFVAQEKTAPYLVSVMELDFEALSIGRRQMKEAIATFKECTDKDVWPGYSPEVHSISLPTWAIDDEMEIAL